MPHICDTKYDFIYHVHIKKRHSLNLYYYTLHYALF